MTEYGKTPLNLLSLVRDRVPKVKSCIQPLMHDIYSLNQAADAGFTHISFLCLMRLVVAIVATI
jgi:hypothetical protein